MLDLFRSSGLAVELQRAYGQNWATPSPSLTSVCESRSREGSWEANQTGDPQLRDFPVALRDSPPAPLLGTECPYGGSHDAAWRPLSSAAITKIEK